MSYRATAKWSDSNHQSIHVARETQPTIKPGGHLIQAGQVAGAAPGQPDVQRRPHHFSYVTSPSVLTYTDEHETARRCRGVEQRQECSARYERRLVEVH